ncbi:MAG: hypothetical protein IKS82_03940 [Bacteroidales bacterium]|nr:hypothetical protein [Bacteroidales bacterium]
MKELLINFAFDSNNKIVFAKDANKGVQYKCPECGEELIFKSSGKSGPGSRRPHFAHKGGGGLNCTPESLLHSAFKQRTAEILHGKIASGCNDFIINWKCNGCNKSYTGNLLFMAKDVKVELDLGICRPDIALLDTKGKVVFAIEIVNTHYPEEAVLKHYRDNGIVLIQYNVTEDDLLDVEGKMHNPDNVSLCLDSKCKEFKSTLLHRTVIQSNIECIRCHRVFQGYTAVVLTVLGHNLLSNISKSDVEYLKNNGVDLRGLFLQKVTIAGNSFLAMAPNCNCMPRLVMQLPCPVKKSRRF